MSCLVNYALLNILAQINLSIALIILTLVVVLLIDFPGG